MEPFFIVGCGRSGTTYIKELLNSHPDIFVPSESLFIVDYLDNEVKIPYKILKYFLFREPQLKNWYNGKEFDFISTKEAIDKVHQISMHEKDAIIWGQKTPRFIRYIPLLKQHFPFSKWIFVYRDPRAVVNSMLKSNRHTYSLKKACARWITDNRILIEHQKSKKDNCIFIKYEDFLDEFDDVLMKIFNFLEVENLKGLNINQISTYKIEENKNSKFNNNSIRDTLNPIKSIQDKWQTELSEEQILLIEQYCKEEMKFFEYPFVSLNNTNNKKLSIPEIKGFFDINLLGKDLLIILQYLINWPSYLFFTIFRKIVFKTFRIVKT